MEKLCAVIQIIQRGTEWYAESDWLLPTADPGFDGAVDSRRHKCAARAAFKDCWRDLKLQPGVHAESTYPLLERGYVAQSFINMDIPVLHSSLPCRARSDLPENRHGFARTART